MPPVERGRLHGRTRSTMLQWCVGGRAGRFVVKNRKCSPWPNRSNASPGRRRTGLRPAHAPNRRRKPCGPNPAEGSVRPGCLATSQSGAGGVESHHIQDRCRASSRTLMSRVIGNPSPGVQSPLGDHCCRCRGAFSQRGRPHLQSRQILGLRARRSLPHRRRGSLRATLEKTGSTTGTDTDADR